MTSRVAVVTGAASGIGAAISAELTERGWTVAGLDLQAARDTAMALSVDISDGPAVKTAIDVIRNELGPVEALITAAGHYEIVPFSNISVEAWTKMLRVHLGGLRNTAHAVLPEMIERRNGAIIAITSELAIGGGNGEVHYAAAKGAIIGFVRSLAAEVAGYGVRVNAVAPGPTDTPLLAADSPWRQPEYLATLPGGRLARPDEIAQSVQYLLDESKFTVGEIMSPNTGAVI